MTLESCPCGGYNGKTQYEDCCAPYHRGLNVAANPEVLMRSRYSAFALGDFAYLAQTWAEQTRPQELSAQDNPVWLKLEIVSTRVSPPPKHHLGAVHFKAYCKQDDGERYCLEERSRFIKQSGAWYYLDGKSSFTKA